MEESLRPFITVGLCFYNREKTLANAIRSVLLQTYTNFELILIDDGSTDGSYNIAKSFSESDSRIKLIKGESNLGIPTRLNQVTDMAKGKYIARMDSDDMMMPQKLEKQLAVLVNNPEIDLVDCPVYIVDNNYNPVGKWRSNDISNLDIGKILRKKICFYHATLVAKTTWFKKNRYNTSFTRGSDFELWCRGFNGTTYARLEEYQYLYRDIDLSAGKYRQNRKGLRKTLRLHYKGNLTSAELKKEIGITYIQSFVYSCIRFLRLQSFLSARRNQPLEKAEEETIRRHINNIKDFNHSRLQPVNFQ